MEKVLQNGKHVRKKNSGSFMWWHEGKSESTVNTAYPERDKFQQEAAKKGIWVKVRFIEEIPGH